MTLKIRNILIVAAAAVLTLLISCIAWADDSVQAEGTDDMDENFRIERVVDETAGDDLTYGEYAAEVDENLAQSGAALNVSSDYTGFASSSEGVWYVRNGQIASNLTSVVKGNINGVTAWWYVKEGKVCYVNAIARNSNGWWYIRNGKVDFSYTGAASNSKGDWYVENGNISFKVNGLKKMTLRGETAFFYLKNSEVQYVDAVVKNSRGWWYVKNGRVDFSYNGLSRNGSEWWLFKNGKFLSTYTGFAANKNGIFYCVNGKVDFTVTGFINGTINGVKDTWTVINGQVRLGNVAVKYNGVWRASIGGHVDLTYTGFASNSKGDWYFKNGALTSTTGLVKSSLNDTLAWWYVVKGKISYVTTFARNSNGIWYVIKGKINMKYTGIASYVGYNWFVEKGKVQTDFSGVREIGGHQCYVVDGKVVMTLDEEDSVFNEFTSPLEGGNLYIEDTISNESAGISYAEYAIECPHACGCEVHSVLMPTTGHLGIDIREWNSGRNVLAVADGVVVYVNHQTWENSGGSCGSHPGEAIAVYCGNGLIYEYHELHSNSVTLKVGDKVQAGDIIGKTGITGVTTGVHVHLSVLYWTGAEKTKDFSDMPIYYGPGTSGYVQINPLYFFGTGLSKQADFWYDHYTYRWIGSDKTIIPGDPRDYSKLSSWMKGN